MQLLKMEQQHEFLFGCIKFMVVINFWTILCIHNFQLGIEFKFISSLIPFIHRNFKIAFSSVNQKYQKRF